MEFDLSYLKKTTTGEGVKEEQTALFFPHSMPQTEKAFYKMAWKRVKEAKNQWQHT